MKNSPKISIIVPIYNVEQYLCRCVDSILNQTFTDFELILIDDGSPDKSGQICDEYAKNDNRIHVIHKENGGLSDARNAGIDWVFNNSDSEWITFIDSDDWVHKQYLKLLYDTAKKYNCEISCCGCVRVKDYIADVNIQSYKTKYGTVEKLITTIRNYDLFNISVACGRLYKKYCFKNIRFPIGRVHEDEFIIHRILFVCNNIAIVKESLYYYFENTDSISLSKMTIKRMADQLDALEYEFLYFYGKSNILFNNSFVIYCRILKKYLLRYQDDEAYFNELKTREKRLESFYANNMKWYAKKYSYSQYSDIKYKRESLKNDFLVVSNQKGFLYAFLWKIKKKIKNKDIR